LPNTHSLLPLTTPPMTLPDPVKQALRIALIYAAWLLVAALVSGHTTFHGRPLWVVVALYLAGGLAVGAAVALVQPRLRARWHACAFGVALAFPLALAINELFLPLYRLRVKLLGSLLGAVIYGTMYALIYWRPPTGHRRGVSSVR